MYCSHFNLKKKPFQLSSDNSFLWLGETHARALDLLKRGIGGPDQLLILTGDIGTGKTTLIHELRHCLPQTTAVAHISDPSIELNYLYLSIAQGLGFDGLYTAGEKFDPVLWAFLNRWRRARKKCVIIIDEAHLIPDQFLAQLSSWVKFVPDNTLTILLSGQLELHQVMEKKFGRSWEGQVDVHAMLFPLKEKQTRDYINRRLELAGAAHKIFAPGAVREVYRYTKGIPRRINIACDQAMTAAYSNKMQTVGAQIFKESVGILELPQLPPVVSKPAPISQTPPAAPGPGWRTKKLPALAVAVLLAVISCMFYLGNLYDSDKIINNGHGPTWSIDTQTHHSTTKHENNSAACRDFHINSINTPAVQKSPVIVKAIVVPKPADRDVQKGLPGTDSRQEPFQNFPQSPSTPSEKIAVESDRSADMDAFIYAVFMMNKADSIIRVPDPSSPLTARNAPAPETPNPAAAVLSASRRRDSDLVRVLTAQPEPDAIIEWLIKENFR